MTDTISIALGMLLSTGFITGVMFLVLGVLDDGSGSDDEWF